MTLNELQDLLNDLTWEQFESNGEDYLAKLIGQCDQRKIAMLICLKWFNANRPDEGHLTVI